MESYGDMAGRMIAEAADPGKYEHLLEIWESLAPVVYLIEIADAINEYHPNPVLDEARQVLASIIARETGNQQ